MSMVAVRHRILGSNQVADSASQASGAKVDKNSPVHFPAPVVVVCRIRRTAFELGGL